jgi:CheY-like chemotaxis protein
MLDHEDAHVLPLDPRPLVLVVTHELTPRSIVTRLVRTIGYQARSCHSGATALALIRGHEDPVRLVLADLAMPRMDGGELAERVRDMLPRLPVALMAGHGDPHVDDLLAGYHDLPFIAKPVAQVNLAELLAHLVGPPSPVPERRSLPRAAARPRRAGEHRAH